MTPALTPGDALAKSHVISDGERAGMIRLLGQTMERLNNPAPFAEEDRGTLRVLVGLLVARLHEAALTQRLTYLEMQLADIQKRILTTSN